MVGYVCCARDIGGGGGTKDRTAAGTTADDQLEGNYGEDAKEGETHEEWRAERPRTPRAGWAVRPETVVFDVGHRLKPLLMNDGN